MPEKIINCHTHIFTADHVPPYLAKSYIPWPFYYLLPLSPIVGFFRWWYGKNGPVSARRKAGYKRMQLLKTKIFAFFDRLYPFNVILGYYVFLFAFFLLYSMLLPVFPPDKSIVSEYIHKAWIFMAPIFPVITATWIKAAIVIFVLLFFESIRNFILFFARLLWKALGKLPGPQTKEMLQRYLNIGRYAFHKNQKTILSKLKDQYPNDTGFVVLPMDMEYMDAGRCKTRYRDQMEELQKVKDMPSNEGKLYPFVFADPRRFVDVKLEKNSRQGDKPYFAWKAVGNKVELEDCFVKDFLETHRFSGIKIYPALGYYPFDEQLLPLWRYCTDNQIPVLTHCIRGTIFYRGVKKQDWNSHPVFEQAMEKEDVVDNHDGYKNDEDLEKERPTVYIPLVLSQNKNVDFSYNFTHPLNYLCILQEDLLRKVLAEIVDRKTKELGKYKTQVSGNGNDPLRQKIDEIEKYLQNLKQIFGYTNAETELGNDLRDFKICFGHFGGDDEWRRYFEKDRYSFSNQLTKHPKTGINFAKNADGTPARGKYEHLWKYTDWYSIICSMMLRYDHVYADLSYILHDNAILPLLKQTILNDGLKDRVLYGTDFFVVRNHKSDKNMLADMKGGLSKEDFELIAVSNPVDFLSNQLKPGTKADATATAPGIV